MDLLNFLHDKYDSLIIMKEYALAFFLYFKPAVVSLFVLFVFILAFPFGNKIEKQGLELCKDKLKGEEILSVCKNSKGAIFHDSIIIGIAGLAFVFMPVDLLHIKYAGYISLISFIVSAIFGAYITSNTLTIYTKEKIIFITIFFRKQRTRELKYNNIQSYTYWTPIVRIVTKEGKIAGGIMPKKKEEWTIIENLIRNGGENGSAEM